MKPVSSCLKTSVKSKIIDIENEIDFIEDYFEEQTLQDNLFNLNEKLLRSYNKKELENFFDEDYIA